MNLFRRKKVIPFEEREVEIYELNVKSLLKLANGEYKSNEELIADNSNLTLEEFEEMRVEAFYLIEKEFFKLNEEFLEEGEKTDKKKS